MSFFLSPPPKFQYIDEDGNPLSGGKLYTYAAGTSTPLATYTTSAGSTPNANPIILGVDGTATIYLTADVGYKFILKTSADVTVWTQDNIEVGGGGGEPPSGTEGAVLFFGADTFITEDPTNFFYNSTTKRLLVGPEATLFSSATGNLGFGATAGDSITTGDRNILFGTNAGTAVTTGSDNIFMGNAAGAAVTTAIQNIGIGTDALAAVTTTSEANIAVGYQAMGSSTTNGGYNVAIGYRAMRTAASGATENVAIGFEAMGDMAGTGDVNVAIGTWALRNVTTGGNNNAIGGNAGSALTTGSANNMMGTSAGTSLTTATGVTAIGDAALSGATGSNGTALGATAGETLTTAANATMIGAETDGTSGDGNQTSLGYQATCTGANQITLGNASVATLRCQQTSITALSDERDKADIEDLAYGLDFLNTLKPRQFRWNRRDGGDSTTLDLGFIAQELQAVDSDRLRLVYAINTDRLEATPGRLLPILVKAIQELSAQVEALRK